MKNLSSIFLLFAVIACVGLFHGRAIAADDRIPKIVLSGLEDYKAFGSKKAVITWLKNSPYENSTYAATLSDSLAAIEEIYGSYKSYELIRKMPLSAGVDYYFLTIKLDNGPIFAKFMLYRTNNDWIIESIDVDKKFENVVSEHFAPAIIGK